MNDIWIWIMWMLFMAITKPKEKKGLNFSSTQFIRFLLSQYNIKVSPHYDSTGKKSKWIPQNPLLNHCFVQCILLQHITHSFWVESTRNLPTILKPWEGEKKRAFEVNRKGTSGSNIKLYDGSPIDTGKLSTWGALRDRTQSSWIKAPRPASITWINWIQISRVDSARWILWNHNHNKLDFNLTAAKYEFKWE